MSLNAKPMDLFDPLRAASETTVTPDVWPNPHSGSSHSAEP
jgi:hypothetical protein